MKIKLEPLILELKVKWKISRNESLSKHNFVVTFQGDGCEGKGEVAPNVRYGETPESIKEQFENLPRFSSPEEVLRFVEENEIFHSLKCGLVCAAIALRSLVNGRSIEEELGLSKNPSIPTSISVPIMEENLLKAYVEQISRFPFIKVKVNEENAAKFTREIGKLSDRPLRIDANEAFRSAESFMDYVESIKGLNVQFIEQPFKASDIHLYKQVKGKCPFEVMADESIEDSADFELLAEQFDSINIKLMKTGGYIKAVELISKAKDKGLKVMLGCMIESSLGISCAMRLGSMADYFDLDGSLLIKNDPFQYISEDKGSLTLN